MRLIHKLMLVILVEEQTMEDNCDSAGGEGGDVPALKKISVRKSTYLYIVRATCTNKDFDSHYLKLEVSNCVNYIYY